MSVDAPAAPWWQRDLELHRQRDGRCPRCGTRKRCWPWATANAARVVARMTAGR
ncbi:hypothetical protein OOK41_01390 [Micromonospora sp. NBC_01655]|uniref:hypothetical protein n=1 Tax=Micromonospora sp. NBC_01655 TaxID=2975983 RepID=UPI002253D117|nr:hypothetical protein [Micromonospora sp. NBC_01655]MCX4468978.1 hypothetical protein [Micromonospora sp. NBC_01655]